VCVVASHILLMQLMHAPPSAPQAPFAVPIWQVKALEQQPGQVELSQRQTPPVQCRP
jgi:hypothetical protein